MKVVTISKIVNGYLVQAVPQWEHLEAGVKIRRLGPQGKYDPIYCKSMDQVLAAAERMLEGTGGEKKD